MLITTPRDHLVAGTGFELLRPSGYEPDELPFRSTRDTIHIYMVEDDGIEPPTPACKAGAPQLS